LSLSALNVAATEDFTGFTGAGFQPTPAAGQLDSDTWNYTGMSSPASVAFGGTQTSGDAARGASTGGVTTGGIYSFDWSGAGEESLGIQPGGSDWTPGTIGLRIENNTGGVVTDIDVSYDVYILNNAPRANSFDFGHSASSDFSGLLSVGSATVTSVEAADALGWVQNQVSFSISGLNIADGASYYFQFSGDDVSGSGSRDEFALDNLSVTAIPEPSTILLIGLAGVLGFAAHRRRKNA